MLWSLPHGLGQLPEKLGRSGVAAGPRVVARTETLRTQSARHGVDHGTISVHHDARAGPAHAGDAGADQRLVAEESEGKADQDRREGREPRPLCRLPDGRGRHPTANVPGDSAAHRGTAAAATTSASMRRSTVLRSRATDGGSASECQGKRPDQPLKHHSDGLECRSHPPSRIWASSQFRKHLPSTPVQGSSGESRLRTHRTTNLNKIF
jgi:hypothetical protein